MFYCLIILLTDSAFAILLLLLLLLLLLSSLLLKGKIVSVYYFKAYRGNSGIAPPILDLGTRVK